MLFQNRCRSTRWAKLAAVAFMPLAGIALHAAEDRISGPVDLSRTTVLSGQVHPMARPEFDQGPVDPSMPMNRITVLLRPDPSLDAFLEELHTPGSPNYRKFLTPEQFGERFGAGSGDLATLRKWLESAGLKVTDLARGRHWLAVTGDAASAGRAFHTEFHRYRVSGKMHFANATEPSIPAAFRSVVAGIYGLHDFRLQPLAVAAKPFGAHPDANIGASHFLAPDDFATIFDISALYSAGIDGTGQNIAVAGQTALNLSDIRNFRSRFNLPPSDPQLVLVGRSPGNLGGLELAEADLDIEWSGATAPNANIIFVYSDDAFTSAEYIIDQNLAPVMTFSFGACEQSTTPAFHYIAQQANAQGITWMAASGDAGTATCDVIYGSPTPQSSLGISASFPADFPEITAVGGTRLNEGAGTYWASTNDGNGGSALSYIPEMAWNDSAERNDLASTGGAPSLIFAQPVWQTGPGVPMDGARHVPDVSFPASPDHDGYEVITGGALNIFGGTSVSSPAFAGVLALLNQYLTSKGVLAKPGLGNINPDLYRLAQSSSGIFHDITAGDNQVPCVQASPGCVNGMVGYSAGPGYDMTTGLGSVDVNNLVTQWSTANASTVSLSATPTSAGLGDTVQLTATVSGGGAVPTGTVNFLSNSVNLGSATLAGGVATVSLTGVQLAGAGGVVTALYSGDAVYDGSGATTKVGITMPAKGSAVVPTLSPQPVFANQNLAGNYWLYDIVLANLTSTATTLTGFVIDGTDESSQIPVWFGSNKIGANGSLSTSLEATGLVPPVNRVFTFSGTDADGTLWTQSITVPFLGPAGPSLFPQISLTATPASVVENPQADPTCRWAAQLTIQEKSGFPVVLSRFSAGGTDFSTSISKMFGTNRLAPYGTLQATWCAANLTPPATQTVTVSGSTNAGSISATATVQFAAPSSNAATFTVSPASITIPAGSDLSGVVPAKLSLNFTGNQPQWTITVLPVNGSASWLSVSAVSGSGPAQISLAPQASAQRAISAQTTAGLLQAMLLIQSPDAIPQYLTVPVSLVIGASTSTSIAGAANNASAAPTFAPGEQIAVYGTQLAPARTAAGASRFPLPLTLAGVSATINGVSAPLYYASPGQLDLQIPYETAAGSATLAVNNNGQVATFLLTVAPTAPGLYGIWTVGGLPATSANPGDLLVAYMTGDGDVTPSLATGATPSSSTVTGFLPKPRQAVSISVGGVTVPSNQVLFVGIPPGVAGVTQINFTVPASVPAGKQAVVVTVGGVASPPVSLNIGGGSAQ